LLQETNEIRLAYDMVVSEQQEKLTKMIENEKNKYYDILKKIQNDKSYEIEFEVKTKMDKFYRDSEKEMNALANELKTNKEEEIRRIKISFDQIIDELKSENETMNTNIRTMKID